MNLKTTYCRMTKISNINFSLKKSEIKKSLTIFHISAARNSAKYFDENGTRFFTKLFALKLQKIVVSMHSLYNNLNKVKHSR
jgi:hypothetical protein